jgi:hypothetical protein
MQSKFDESMESVFHLSFLPSFHLLFVGEKVKKEKFKEFYKNWYLFLKGGGVGEGLGVGFLDNKGHFCEILEYNYIFLSVCLYYILHFQKPLSFGSTSSY